jgi:hypothetical protein
VRATGKSWLVAVGHLAYTAIFTTLILHIEIIYIEDLEAISTSILEHAKCENMRKQIVMFSYMIYKSFGLLCVLNIYI